MKLEEIASQIDAASTEIWSSMVNIPLTSIPVPEEHLFPRGITSSVQIVGKWNGAVRLDMSMDTARQATASLLGADPAELTVEEIRDAAGELANMTAGGVKELLPGPCQISLPTVVMGADFELSVPQGTIEHQSAFNTGIDTFLVTIIHGDGEAQPASGTQLLCERCRRSSPLEHRL